MNLKGFLKNNAIAPLMTEDFIVSPRFLDENGNPIPFKLRLLNPKEITEIQNSGLIDKGGKFEYDSKAMQLNLVVATIQEPDLLNAELLASYGVNTPHELINEMLTGAEFLKLVTKCMNMQGLNQNINDKVKIAKN